MRSPLNVGGDGGHTHKLRRPEHIVLGRMGLGEVAWRVVVEVRGRVRSWGWMGITPTGVAGLLRGFGPSWLELEETLHSECE